MILVTGASGQFGHAAIQALLDKNYPANEIYALVRDEAKGEDLKALGVNLRIGDYESEESLVKAFEGIDKVLFVSASDVEKRWPQHENVVNAMTKAGVKHVVYTSYIFDENKGDSAIDFIIDTHIKTEELIKNTSLKYTFMQNNLYMDFVPVFAGEQVLENGIYFPAGDGKMAVVLRSEMAEAAVNALLSSEHENKTYNISNSEAYTYQDVADAISEITGKTVPYISPSRAEYETVLGDAGVPQPYIAMFSGFAQAIKEGDLDKANDDFANLLGRKPTDLKTYLKEVFA